MLMVTPRSADMQALPAFIRARGGVRLAIGPTPRGSAPLRVAESGGYRARFPRSSGVCEGVLINTGGGLAGGDRMTIHAAIAAGASAVLTTQAAEKVYRSDGAATEIAVELTLEERSRLEWLPQEHILFDGARLRRTLDAAMAGNASLTLVESAVFGRVAMGEALAAGAFRDRWRVRRDGRLIFAEDLRLEGDIERTLARRAVANGARSLATVLHVAPDAELRLSAAREALEHAASECGASVWNGMLVARFLSPDPHRLRADLARFLERFRGRPLPRSWQT
jgi:urease accessory protein